MTATLTAVLEFGKRNDACAEAMRWLRTQENAEQAWLTCERPDWMIWYAKRRSVEHKTLVRIACDCARTALRFVPEGEHRPRLAIETTERWLVGEATIAEVRSATYAAYATVAAYAADAADAAVAAAVAAAYAAYAAYAADAAAYAARRQANIQMCDIVRTHIRYEDIAL